MLHPVLSPSRHRYLARRLSRGVALAPLALSSMLWIQPASAQVVLDGTLGPAGALGGPHYNIPAALGQKFGPNLFHSFSDFNIYAGESASFSGPGSIQNILSRVTGGQSSIIDGKLNSTIAGANFFFINPAGVIFGPDAQINVSGNFTASTADALKLGSNGVFRAQNPSASVLTSAPPSAFGFLEPNPQPIQFFGSNIVAAPGRSLSLVGGDISLEGASVTSQDGKIHLASVGSAGEAKIGTDGSIDTNSFETLGNVDLDNSDIVATRSGGIGVHAGNLSLKGESYLSAENDSMLSGGAVKVQARGDVSLAEGSVIQALSLDSGKGGTVEIEASRVLIAPDSGVATIAFASGDGGDIRIKADKISINGRDSSDLTGIAALALPSATGNGGNILMTTGDLTSEYAAAISVDNFGSGQGGNITIDANHILLNGHGGSNIIGAESNEIDSGRGGHITIKADTLKLINGGGISTSTASIADGGNIDVSARDILITGGGADFTGIESISIANNGGNAGDIAVKGQRLLIESGGEIAVDTFGSGKGGKIAIHVNDVELNSQDSAASFLARSFDTGRGGDIEVVADRLHLIGNAVINTNTGGIGGGGDIRVRSEEVLFDGRTGVSDQSNGVFAQSNGAGKGGNVNIAARDMKLLEGGTVSTSTGKNGNGGTIRLAADKLTLDGTKYTTGLTSATFNEGNSGRISVAARELNLRGNALISTTTAGTGNGGSIDIAAEHIVMDGRGVANQNGIASESRAHNGGNSGKITIKTEALKVSNGAAISTNTQGMGNGNGISIKAREITLSSRDSAQTGAFSSILAQTSGTAADAGDSGNVTIETDKLLLQDGATISTTTGGAGEGGNIQIKADEITMQGDEATAQISAQALGKSADAGNGGIISLETETLRVIGKAAISTTSFGAGNSGNILINARDTVLDGQGAQGITGLTSESHSLTNAGNSGKIELRTDTFKMLNGAQVSTSTTSSGDGGDVFIRAREVAVESGSVVAAVTLGKGKGGNINVTTDSLFIRGNGLDSEQGTGFSADTRDDATGDGGAVDIKAKNIVMSEGATISTGSLSRGTGGRITIDTDELSLDSSDIRAISIKESADAGRIDITTRGALRLNASAIRTEALASNGGNITLRIGDTLNAKDSFISASTIGGDGGNLQMQVGRGVILRSSVVAAFAAGSGGDIKIQPAGQFSPQFVVLDKSEILAFAERGNGGNINIQSNVFLPSIESIIDASSVFGLAGNIAIESPNTNVGGSLVTLPSNPLDAESYLAERCVVQQTGQSSSFSVDTRRAMPAPPGDLLPSDTQ